MKKRRAFVIPLITLVIMAALSSMATPAFASGGDFSIDFAAADPSTYDHATAVGGVFADKVESLEGGDFACGDKVVFLAEITVAGGASSAQDIELDFGFLAEPTGQPGVGLTDLLSASGNPGDGSGNTGNTTVSIESEGIDTSGSKDELQATVGVQNLDPGEVFILRLVVLITCIPNSDPTGNLQGDLSAARVVAPVADVISAGAQTVPFKSVGRILQPAAVSVTVGACPAPGSPTQPVTVSISPAGSATVTINGPGGPYVVTGSGDVLDLPPGDYTWNAVAEGDFILDAPTSGQFTVGACPFLPSSVTIEVGACPAPGSPTVPVTITIDPDSSATVTIEGPGGPYVVTETDTLDLPAGDYTWTADADPTFELEVDSGEFTVQGCPFLPATVTVEVGACPAPGADTVPVTITIDPAGSATVTIEGPGGPYVVTETDTLDLPPGAYSWTAEAAPTYELEQDSGEFAVQGCPAIAASVVVTVGACPPTSSTTKPVSVAISPEGGAEVTITGPNGFVAVVTGSGQTLDLTPGDYAWSAVANETFELIGATEGVFSVGSCVIKVLPNELPSTGSPLRGVAAAGLAFLLIGLGMVRLSSRPVLASAGMGREPPAQRLSGRSDRSWLLVVWSWLDTGSASDARAPGRPGRVRSVRRALRRR